MSNKKYNAYLAEVKSGEISESFIRGFRKALHAVNRRELGHSTSVTSPVITFEQVDNILTEVAMKRPRVSKAQGEKGITWLRDIFKTPRGVIRKRSPFIQHDMHILDNYSHFQLVGFEELNAGRGLPFWVPEYRCISTDGAYFDYYAVSWQSGGSGPVITNRGNY